MNTYCVLIPTRNRILKLKRTLESLRSSTPFRVLVAVDGEWDTVEFLWRHESDFPLDVVHSSKHVGSVAIRNMALKTLDTTESVLYIPDDVRLEADCLDHAFDRLEQHGLDSVVGLCQNIDHGPTHMALIGAGFLKRFPNRQLFFPQYYHFAHHEVHHLARDLNLYHYCRKARVTHYHPQYGGAWDVTHDEARLYRNHDHRVAAARKSMGLTWGVKGCEDQVSQFYGRE